MMSSSVGVFQNEVALTLTIAYHYPFGKFKFSIESKAARYRAGLQITLT